jgi:hypothetical protein
MSKKWLLLFAPFPLFALTTLIVTVNTDNNPGDMGDPGDLRYCLNSMNHDLNSIPDDYAIVFASPMTIQLNGILPLINSSSTAVNITIGNPDFPVTIDGNMGSYSGFFIPMGNVTIQNINFQNLTAKGGNGGDGIAGGGGGMGAGGAIYVPETFLNGSNPNVTLMNVTIDSCSAIGGNGGSYLSLPSPTGNEGGGGGGGFSGNGGSITTTGTTGGAGGGGFGGNGGDVTLTTSDLGGGGGGGGGGIGSRANTGSPLNLGNGGSDQSPGSDGSGYDLSITAGSGGGGFPGGTNAGGGGGGGDSMGGFTSGGGGGGSSGLSGGVPEGTIPPGGAPIPSGGFGGDGGGGGGAGIVASGTTNSIDGRAGSGGYGGGGGGGAGVGFSDPGYTVEGGFGGMGGGGGGGGVNQSGTTSATGGPSQGGGGGGGGGPSDGINAGGGYDLGGLGGGSGGEGANTYGSGGGGGGGGSGIGAAIFIDLNLNFTIKAFPGVPTTFNTLNNTTQAGVGGVGSPGALDGAPGSAFGNSIFLRTGASLTLVAEDSNDLLTLGDEVSFADDTSFGGGGTNVNVTGNGTVVYNGTTDYQGRFLINNANFKVNGLIDQAPIFVCRNVGFSPQRGTLSGRGTLTGDVYANSGAISPDAGETLTLGSLILNPEDTLNDTLGSLVHIEISPSATSLVAVNGAASLRGALEIAVDPSAVPGTYTILTSSGITGAFDSVVFTGEEQTYELSYLPLGAPTFVQIAFLNPAPLPPSNLQGKQSKNDFGLQYEFYNQITWTASPSPGITSYFIYRDGKKIAEVNSSIYTYQDHGRKKGVSYTYTITASNTKDIESSPINIVITP